MSVIELLGIVVTGSGLALTLELLRREAARKQERVAARARRTAPTGKEPSPRRARR